MIFRPFFFLVLHIEAVYFKIDFVRKGDCRQPWGRNGGPLF